MYSKKVNRKLLIRVCLDEINATVKNVQAPLIRKTYLTAKKWYKLQKDKLVKLEYRGKIAKLPKHKVKPDENEEKKEEN